LSSNSISPFAPLMIFDILKSSSPKKADYIILTTQCLVGYGVVAHPS
jgi:hypothetical protein